MVIKRGDLTDDLQDIPATPTIIFSYVGSDTSKTENTLLKRKCPVLLIATSEQLLSKSCSSIISNLPVAVSFWTRAPKEVRYTTSYIGNKKNLPDDEPSIQLASRIAKNEIDVWGRYWKGHCPEEKRHPPVTVFTVPEIFSRSATTFGLMYPYQRRTRTYSGRYWLAPLAGCFVYAECDNHCYMPGIIYGQHAVGSDLPTLQERQLLSQTACSFWEKETAILQEKVATWWKDNTGRLAPISPIHELNLPLFSHPILSIMRFSSQAETLALSRGVDFSPFNLAGFWQ